MRRTALALMATLVLVLMMAVSTTAALAGWDYWDCPPAATAAFEHSSDQAKANWAKVFPPAPDVAWAPHNPGKK